MSSLKKYHPIGARLSSQKKANGFSKFKVSKPLNKDTRIKDKKIKK